jgi:hypothetical protein
VDWSNVPLFRERFEEEIFWGAEARIGHTDHRNNIMPEAKRPIGNPRDTNFIHIKRKLEVAGLPGNPAKDGPSHALLSLSYSWCDILCLVFFS